jgi:hypothetical protein
MVAAGTFAVPITVPDGMEAVVDAEVDSTVAAVITLIFVQFENSLPTYAKVGAETAELSVIAAAAMAGTFNCSVCCDGSCSCCYESLF